MENKEEKKPLVKGGPGMGRGPVEKPKDFKKTLRRLIGYIGKYNKLIIMVCLILITGTVLSVVSPKILGKATTELANNVIDKIVYTKINTMKDKLPANVRAMIDKDTTVGKLIDMKIIPENVSSKIPESARDIKLSEEPKINYDYIGKIILIISAMYVLSGLLTYIANRTMGYISQKVTYNLRKEVDAKLDRLPISFFDKHTHGELLSRITNDIDNISTMLQQSFVQILQAVFTILGIFVMMLSISLSMSGAALLIIPASVIFIAVVIKASQKHFVAQQKILGELNSHIEETYSGYTVVKSFNMEEKEKEKFRNVNESLYESGYKSQFLSGLMMPIIAAINNLGYIAICVIGAKLAIKGTLSIGNIQAFIQYTNQFTQPIAQTANMFNMIQGTIAASERVFEILDEKEEIADKDNVKHNKAVEGNVRFENVTFSYDENVKLIEDFNLDVKEGQTVAIVGATGAGKTTIVNLLMRFYNLKSGRILVDDISIDDMERKESRKMFSMVLQDTWVFNGTIKENIKYGRQEATDEEVKEAAKLAHVHHFISALPGGYDFVLTEDATNISSGQKQLLTIARAVLANSPILILDEATSNVDTRTEELIQKAMIRLMEGKTSFVIAHRLSTIRNADIIIVMDKGKIIEKGNHEELLKLGKHYAKLYNSQFSEESA